MEFAARQFVRRVLLLHLVLLAVVVVLISLAAKQVYEGAREQAIEQATKRQSLLAEQTAQGIAGYYQSIIDNFELMQRWERDGDDPRDLARPARIAEAVRVLFLPALWHQIESRASRFMLLDRELGRVVGSFPADAGAPDTLLAQNAAWIDSVDKPAVSKLVNDAGQQANLVCVPVPGAGRRMLIAVVPLEKIKKQFLDAVNAEENMAAMLLDDKLTVMAAFDPQLIGLSIVDDASDPNIRELANRYIELGRAGTEVVQSSFTVGSHRFEKGIVSVVPVQAGQKRWWLSIGAGFADVDGVVRSTFRDALVWSVFLVASVTAILISTAWQMIRTRVSLERARHEILSREIAQARKIQLAWLPDEQDEPRSIDLAAVNRPASQISGDFYNWFDLCDGRLCVVIGDVTGHGMAATFLMATTQLLVRMIMPRVMDPAECLREVNRELCQQVFNGQFVTMLIAILDRHRGELRLCSAGHPAPLLRTAVGFESMRIEPDLVLGIEPEYAYRTQAFKLPSGAAIVLYTDGVIDAVAPDGTRLGLDGLLDSLNGNPAGADTIAGEILSGVDRFRRNRDLADDLTLVVVETQCVGSLADAATR